MKILQEKYHTENKGVAIFFRDDAVFGTALE
jgi:hypothetical protein